MRIDVRVWLIAWLCGCADRPASIEAEGGQIGEQSTLTLSEPRPPRGLLWVAGPQAAGGGDLRSLAAGRMPPNVFGDAIGEKLVDLGGIIAVNRQSGEQQSEILLLTRDDIARSVSFAEVFFTGESEQCRPPFSSVGDLVGDDTDEIGLHHWPDEYLIYNGNPIEAADFEVWAVLEGDSLRAPLPIATGALVLHFVDGAAHLATIPEIVAGRYTVSGGVPLPPGAALLDALGDVDGDGVAEVWVQGGGEGWLLAGASAGEGTVMIELAETHQLLDLGDLDGDGRAESVRCAQQTGQVQLQVLQGAELSVGSVSGAELRPVSGRCELVAANLDGQGAPELIVPDDGGWWVLSIDSGASAWIEEEDRYRYWPPIAHTAGDIDGDGTDDLVFGMVAFETPSR